MLTIICAFGESYWLRILSQCWWMLIDWGVSCWRLACLWQFLKIKTTVKFAVSVDSSFHKWFLCSVWCCLIAFYHTLYRLWFVVPQNDYKSKTSKITDHCNKYKNNEKVWNTGRHRHEVSRCYRENSADRLVRCRVATNLQFVKNAIICEMQWSKAL